LPVSTEVASTAAIATARASNCSFTASPQGWDHGLAEQPAAEDPIADTEVIPKARAPMRALAVQGLAGAPELFCCHVTPHPPSPTG
jgi:hypothetical protein